MLKLRIAIIFFIFILNFTFCTRTSQIIDNYEGILENFDNSYVLLFKEKKVGDAFLKLKRVGSGDDLFYEFIFQANIGEIQEIEDENVKISIKSKIFADKDFRLVKFRDEYIEDGQTELKVGYVKRNKLSVFIM